MRARYEVIGINGPYDQRPIYSTARLKDAKECAAAVLVQGATFPEGYRTFKEVQVFKSGTVLGRLVASFSKEVPK